MAATWTYSDWTSQATIALKLTRIRLHIQEVADYLAGFRATGSDSRSGQRHPLDDYLDTLFRKLDELEIASGVHPSQITEPIIEARPKVVWD